jgi:hypothetical protein
MEEQEKIDPQYIKGFNHGYLINEHEPKLLDKVLKSKNESIYFKALAAGKRQQEWDVAYEEVRQANQALNERQADREID